MKTSCVTHPPDDYFVQIHSWQLTFCKGNQCAAALLSCFEFGHNGKTIGRKTSLWQEYTTQQLENYVLVFKRATIADSINWLSSTKAIQLSVANAARESGVAKVWKILFVPEAINSWLKQFYISSPSCDGNLPKNAEVPSQKCEGNNVDLHKNVKVPSQKCEGPSQKCEGNTMQLVDPVEDNTSQELRKNKELTTDRDAEYEARAQEHLTRNQADMSLHQYRMLTECPGNLRARDRLICRPKPSPRLAEELKTAPEEAKSTNWHEPVLQFMERTFHKAIHQRKMKFPLRWPKSIQFPEEFEQQAERMGYNEYCEAWLEHLDSEKPSPFTFAKQFRSNGHA